MKILFLTQVLPYPPDSGPKVKTLNVLKYLSQNHQVTLISFVRGDQRKETEALRNLCHAVYTVPMRRSLWADGTALLRSFISGKPWLILRDGRKEMFALVRRVAAGEKFDAVHADQLNMAPYALEVSEIRRVLDEHNALWLLYQRLWQTLPWGPEKWLYGREWRLLSKYEGNTCAQFDAVLTVSSEDRQALQSLQGCLPPLEVIPIAVDVELIQPVVREPEADHILHVGTMFWPPNVDGIDWFLRDIYPLIEREKPGVKLDVIGANPPERLHAAARPFAGVSITGYVKDLRPYLQKTGVFVVPLRSGGGMRVKILEALAQGLPVVTTSIGCEGIAVENGVHLWIADTPEEFARATLKVLSDRALADQLGQNGRRLIEARYAYQIALRDLDRIYPHRQEID